MRLADGSWRDRRCKDGSLESERLVHSGAERSLQGRGEPLEKTHLRPLHWHRGTEEFHEESKRFSVLPCSGALILPSRSSTSVEEDDNKHSVSVAEKVMVMKK